MIYIPIFIIIIILGLDLYFTYSARFEKTSNEKFDNENEQEEQDETFFENPNPWNKIQYFTHINKYYIQIEKLNDHIEKIILWKSLPIIKTDLIDIDIENNYLILRTHSEEEALVICNLIINHINNNLTINDIISKNLINYSINKAKRFKLIGTKLTELIKEGLLELNNQMENAEPLDYIDTDEMEDKEKKRKEKKKADIINKVKFNESDKNEKNKDKFINNNVKEIRKDLFDRIEPYEGFEYASIKF
jgi:hypothetical protein